MTLLNLAWPALYILEEMQKFWFFVVTTIVIKATVIRMYLKFEWKKSFWISILANLVSAILGSITMALMIGNIATYLFIALN